MGMVILTILKIIGIILLVVLGLILFLLLLVLFVPIRYRIDASKDAEGEQQIHALIKVTWLLHLLNIRFLYPEEAYFRSDQPTKEAASSEKNAAAEKKKESEAKTVKTSKASRKAEDTLLATEDVEGSGEQPQTMDEDGWSPIDNTQIKPDEKTEAPKNQTENATHTEIDSESADAGAEEEKEEAEADSEESTSKWELLREKILWCIRKIWKLLKNIRYTIQSIYDKIRNIIHHIRYYYRVLQSELFDRTWEKYSKEVLCLLKRIAPRKIKGYLHIGMEDPAATGQILGYYGMLYPLIGEHIDVVPDFEHVILEGTLKIRGNITLFQAVRIACTIYFDKDLQKLIRLLKREVA